MTKQSDVPRAPQRFADLAEYIRKTGKRKGWVAREELKIKAYELSMLLDPQAYRPRVDDDLVKRLAALLNQSESYVRKLYPKKAAA